MSTIAAPVTRTTPSPAARSVTQDFGAQAASTQVANASGKQAAPLPVVDPAAASSSSVSLSQRALDRGVDSLGEKTVDAAQKFLSQFAKALFGKAADGASVQFDAVSLSADASLSSQVSHAQSADGSVDAAALDFSESAHFIGRGTIVTDEGQQFAFEIEVKYAASVHAGVTQRSGAQPDATSPPVNDAASAQASSAADAPGSPDLSTLTGKNLPQIKFPGSLADLFKVLGRELQGKADSGNDNGEQGNLSLRLLRLVNSAALLAPRQPADQPAASAADRSKALASYVPTPVSTAVATA
jgi:hypothetical protein